MSPTDVKTSLMPLSLQAVYHHRMRYDRDHRDFLRETDRRRAGMGTIRAAQYTAGPLVRCCHRLRQCEAYPTFA